MEYNTIKEQLIKHEGLRLKPYKCTAGKLTIGVGRNIEDVGISEREAMILLANDVEVCVEDLRGMFDNFDVLHENIQYVLIDMRFQLGMKGFRGFKRMIRAVQHRDWPEMIEQMKESAWYGQTTSRADYLIRMVKDVL